MKILICNTTDTGGGAAKAAYQLLESLTEQGIDARLLVMHKHSKNPLVLNVFDFHDKRSTFGRGIKLLEYKLKNKLRKRKWAKYPERDRDTLDDIFFSHLENSLEKIDFDVLHLHWVEGEFINFKDLKKVQKPIVWTLHGCFPFTGICHHFQCNKYYKTECSRCPILKSEKDDDLSNEMFYLKMKRYQYLPLNIVCPSQWISVCAKESALLGTKPIHVIPNGIDINLFSPLNKKSAREVLNISQTNNVILFGAISPTENIQKGYSYLQEALQIFKKDEFSETTDLLIFGTSDYNSKGTFEFRTRYLGYISNDRLLAIAYSTADVMIVPSTHENLPYTIMESLSCGTPVVAFDIGGNSDMIDHKKNGYLAKPFEAEDLARGIRWCLENNMQNNLGQNARQKVLDNYAAATIARKHIELYRSLINTSHKN
jgi:glycosyltransferase involved in cell wall biosynthesis